MGGVRVSGHDELDGTSRRVKRHKFRQRILAVLAVAVVALAGCASSTVDTAGEDAVVMSVPESRGDRVSPFSAVRVGTDDRLEVRTSDGFFVLKSINGIAAEDLVAFAQREYTSRPLLWVKRIGEDLQEVLHAMGPGLTCPTVVELTDEAATMVESHTLECTRANRKAALQYNQAAGIT